MINKIANYLIKKGLQNSIISDQDVSVYLYGYTLILEIAMNIIVAFIIGLIFNSLMSVIIFLLVFMPLRSYSGGYHANSALSCTIISNLTVLLAVLVVKYGWIDSLVWIVPVIEALLIILIALIAPVDSENKPLNNAEKKRCKKITILILSFCYVCLLVFKYNEFTKPVLIIFVATLVDLISLLVVKAELMRKRLQ